MKLAAFVLLASSTVLLTTPENAVGQWERFDGPETSQINDIEIHEQDLFVATNEGVFRSKDDGNSWVAANSGLPMDVYFRDLEVVDKYVFAIVESDDEPFSWTFRIIRFDTADRAWSEMSNSLPTEEHFSSLQAIGHRLFVGTHSGVYRSDDFGKSWAQIGEGRLFVIHSLAATNILFAATNSRVFWSKDFGDTWVPLAGDLGAQSWIDQKKIPPEDVDVISLVAVDNSLFALAEVYEAHSERPIWGGHIEEPLARRYEALFRSIDNGRNWTLQNWQRLDFDQDFSSFDAISNDNSIFIGTDEGVFRPYNEELNRWSRADLGLLGDDLELQLPVVSSLAVVGENVFAGTWAGVHVSRDGGENWARSSTGLPENTYIDAIAVHGTDLYASAGAHGVFVSRDLAKSWTAIGAGSSTIDVAGVKSVGTDLFASTVQGLYRSSDQGETWIATKPMPGFQFGSNEISIDGPDVLVATSGAIYRSEDRGNNWSNLYAPRPWGIMSLLVVEDTIFFSGYEGGLWRSINSGECWKKLDTGLSIQTDPRDLVRVGEQIFFSSNQGVRVSQDNGESWSPVNAGLPWADLERDTPEDGFWYMQDVPSLVAVGARLFLETEKRIFEFNALDNIWRPFDGRLPASRLSLADTTADELFVVDEDGRYWRLQTGS